MSFIQLKIKIAYIRNFTCIKHAHNAEHENEDHYMQTDDFATLQFIYSFQFSTPPPEFKKENFQIKIVIMTGFVREM